MKRALFSLAVAALAGCSPPVEPVPPPEPVPTTPPPRVVATPTPKSGEWMFKEHGGKLDQKPRR